MCPAPTPRPRLPRQPHARCRAPSASGQGLAAPRPLVPAWPVEAGAGLPEQRAGGGEGVRHSRATSLSPTSSASRSWSRRSSSSLSAHHSAATGFHASKPRADRSARHTRASKSATAWTASSARQGRRGSATAHPLRSAASAWRDRVGLALLVQARRTGDPVRPAEADGPAALAGRAEAADCQGPEGVSGHGASGSRTSRRPARPRRQAAPACRPRPNRR